MFPSESYLLNILKKYSKVGEWKFFEVYKNGKEMPQAKNYGSGFVSYPDFELYSDKKLLLLVEVKGYNGFFEGRDSTVAMKFRCYKSYRQVRMNERVDVRICFVIKFEDGEKIIFWDSIDKISKYPKYIQKHTYNEYNHDTKEVETKTEDFIYWNVEDFRTDEENIAIP